MSERTAVQNPMLGYADAIGWDYVPAAEALRWRGGEGGLFFTDVLRAQLRRLNPGIVDAGRADAIIRQLTLLRADITGNRDLLTWLRGEQSVFVPEEGRERNVRLVDFDDLAANVYHVTDEWRQRNPRCANRADVIFLVNGIPVALCETKNAGKPDGLAIGVDQVRRYHRETPEMLLAPQLFEVTELLDFYYAATWSTSRKDLFNWREERGPTIGSGQIPMPRPAPRQMKTPGDRGRSNHREVGLRRLTQPTKVGFAMVAAVSNRRVVFSGQVSMSEATSRRAKTSPPSPLLPGEGRVGTPPPSQGGGGGVGGPMWSYESAVKSFFDRRRFLKVLRDYIIFLAKDDELTKIILRQHQTRAVEKVIARVADPARRRGLIWHTQGSGKTLTMITIAARLLRHARGGEGEKPTVLMLVDRNELEAQLFRNIVAYGITTVQVAQSKDDLRRILASDYRGLVVAMIHKLNLEISWHDAEDMRWAARHWATRIGVRLRQVSVRPMTTKWASMSTAGRLTLNSDLLGLPRSAGEYVIVHELVHLLAPNHGKVFQSFMSAYLPDWEMREQLLHERRVRSVTSSL